MKGSFYALFLAGLVVLCPCAPASAGLAVVTNLPATWVQGTTATLNGQVLSIGGSSPTMTFYYGPVDGGTNPAAWSNAVPLGIQSSVFTRNISGLVSNKVYFFTSRAVNSFGTNWAAPSRTFFTVNLTPVAVSGFNRDVVVENNATGPPYTTAAQEFNPGEGTAFYQSGLPGASYGLPGSGTFTSAMGDGTIFQFQPYTDSNALVLSSQTGLSEGTLSLATPTTFSRIALLAHSAGGGGTANVSLNFSDGSVLLTNYNAPDWFSNPGFALQGVDRIDLTTGGADGATVGDPRFYQTTFDLAATLGASNKPLSSLTFSMATASATAIYALSGLGTNLVIPPYVMNAPATGVRTTAATLSGALTWTGGETPRVTLYYGPADGGPTAAAWSNSTSLGPQSGAFSLTLTGLSANSTYFFTVQAVNSAGSSWASPSQMFTTLASAFAVVTNLPATSVQADVATLRGQVLASGDDTPSILIFYGPTDGGTDASAWSNNVSIGPQNGAYEQRVSGLSSNTTYYFTSMAVNSGGSAWAGPSQVFTTLLRNPPFPPLKPFPLSANQRSLVSCLEKPLLYYDIYLPPAYSTDSPALPILYTFSAGGGGMVTDFFSVCKALNIICVGIIGPQNDAGWDVVFRQSAFVTRDIRHRVLFDPTAEFASGFSGGGLVSYGFSRFRAQHVAGVFAMSGWLGRYGADPTYETTDRLLTNLLVVRSMGLSDTGRFYNMASDSNYLASSGAVIHPDQWFAGGHDVAPDYVKSNCLAWLVSQRVPSSAIEESNALAQGVDWFARVAAGDKEAVLRECVVALMSHPRSWTALEAQLVLDDLMLDYDSFRPLAVNDLAQGDFSSDLFYYMARGAGDGSDWPRYRSGLKALTGITGVNGDRAGDIRNLLLKYSYPAPILYCAPDTTPVRMNLFLSKDTPGLDYFPEGLANLITDPWQPLALTVLDTNTAWSTKFDVPPGSESGFYRLRTTPSAGSSPPWPGQ